MAFDGIVTKAIVTELQEMIGSKIDKIHEPDRNTIVLGLYHNGKNYALNICIDSHNCRLNLTTHPKENPLFAPNFCMLLRKHLLGGRISRISMLGLERLVKIEIETINEFNEIEIKTLIVELMGKHSNVILLNQSEIIIDSMRHIDSKNSYREILPARIYSIPKSDKKDFTQIKDFKSFEEALRNSEIKVEDLAFDATIRAAAPFQRLREDNGCALNIKSEDLRQKVREKRIGNTFLFAVDASGSMGARERMRAVKGAIFYMLQEAYQKRDRVGMVAFRRQKAELLLPITRSVDLAQKCLAEMPTGGKTPLADGLSTSLLTLGMLNKKDSELEPILILVTDGRANAIEENGGDPVECALKIAEKIRKAKITSVVIDTETDFIKLGVAKAVAKAMGATYYSLRSLSQEHILRIVRNLDV